MGVKWTEEQEKVIRLRNRNILVSAAAGSGKTAVLVERIITMLTKDDPPMDVDRLLIVTFTEAAASEMKERIRLAIEKKLMEYPDNEHLKQQATLIHNAQITTIHSFCLSVIRDHFHAIDIDPGFRIGEEGELKLLRHDVLEDMLEEKYQEGSKRFLDFTAAYSTGRNDKKIEDLILKIYEFSRSYPDSEAWLDSCVKAYEIPDVKALEGSSIMKKVMRDIRKNLEDAKELLIYAENVALSPEGPAVYEATLEKDLQVIEELCNRASYKSLAEAFSNVKWARIAANKDKTVSEEKIDLVKKIREMVKGIVKNMSAQYFYESPEELVEDLRVCAPAMEELADLVRLFAERFEEQKRAQNMIDFSDMEQYALRILTQKTENGFVPSKIAEEYQKQFEEIMIDEYQDSNLIQEAILTSVSGCRSGRYNIFMVGDVKQSIYRFRLSRPELFLEKFRTYNIEESKTQRIDLHKNFRSRKEVLESANAIFRQIMTEKLGGIVYDDQAALYPGAEYPENDNVKTEILVMDSDLEILSKEEDFEEKIPSERELEARMIAMRIRELLRSQKVTDKETGELRNVRYSDIVILTRSIKGFADVFTEVLKREGILTYAGTSEGYFQTQEIGVLMDYLRVLDNRRQDIPLTAVLSSAFAGLSQEELAEIRCAYPDTAFFESVTKYREQGENADIQLKLQKCLDQMDDFRKIVPYTPMHELLWKILETTGYGDYVASMPGGAQRKANLDMLIEKARAYESTSYKGLFHFVRYIEKLKKYDTDFGEASSGDEGDSVRIMSIHKSKGLEFPVVFLAGMGKKFNKQDAYGQLLLDADLGAAADEMDLDLRTKSPTIKKLAIKRRMELESMGEELRVLYVAMTRAKEVLVMTGTDRSLESKLEKWSQLTLTDGQIPYTILASASSFLDWVLMSRSAVPAGHMEMTQVRLDELIGQELKRQLEKKNAKEALLNLDIDQIYDEKMNRQLEAALSYVYPYREDTKLYTQMSVSELKKQSQIGREEDNIGTEREDLSALSPVYERKTEQEEEQDEKAESASRERKNEKSGKKGAFRGTAYHRALECLYLPDVTDLKKLEADLLDLYQRGFLTEEAYESIFPWDIWKFLESPLGKYMQKAEREGKLHRERQFMIGIPASEMKHVFQSEEMVLIQGVIDAYIEEEDGFILIDYKTDHVPKEKADGEKVLKERYQVQLDYYGRALTQLTGKKVKEKWIYSFGLRKAIQLS